MVDQNTPAPADLVEAVAKAIVSHVEMSWDEGAENGCSSEGKQEAIDLAQAAITAMQAYMASVEVTQMDRDLFAHILLSMNGNEWVSEGELRDAPDSHPAFHRIIAHRCAAAITPQPAIRIEPAKPIGAMQITEAQSEALHRALIASCDEFVPPQPDPRDQVIAELREALRFAVTMLKPFAGGTAQMDYLSALAKSEGTDAG